LGVPNYCGVLRILIPYFSPEFFETVNLNAMDIKNWDSFSKQLELEKIFASYIGGFNLRYYLKCERKTIMNQIIRGLLKLINGIFTKINFFKQINSIHCSPYLLGVYKKKLH
jgi:hypothetical protein